MNKHLILTYMDQSDFRDIIELVFYTSLSPASFSLLITSKLHNKCYVIQDLSIGHLDIHADSC